MFQKGHPYYGGKGAKGRSGRKRNPRNAARYFNELYDASSFELAKVTIDKALAGDRELLIYCHDRRLGKIPQQSKVDLGGEISVGTLVRLLGMIQQRRITGGKDAIQRQIEGQGSPQGTNEKEA